MLKRSLFDIVRKGARANRGDRISCLYLSLEEILKSMGKRFQLGLVLGGGGARGLAHIGVLNMLERNNIAIDMIVGTSIGALVGAAYATNPDAGALKQRILEVIGSSGDCAKGLKLLGRMQWDEGTKNEWFNRIYRFAQKEVFLSLAMFKNALLSVEDMRDTVEAFVSDINIEQTTIPFAVSAVDLYTGEQIFLKQGGLIEAVMASCAVPGFMPPLACDGHLLVDGGIANSLPADLARDVGKAASLTEFSPAGWQLVLKKIMCIN
jgi:NTE family protein